MDLQQIKTAFANKASYEAIYFRDSERWLVMADQLYIRSWGSLIIPVEQADGSLFGSPSDYRLAYTSMHIEQDTIAQTESVIAAYKQYWQNRTISCFDTEGNWHENVKIVEIDHTNFGDVGDREEDEEADCYEIYFSLNIWHTDKWGTSRRMVNAATIMCREMASVKRLTDKEMASVQRLTDKEMA